MFRKLLLITSVFLGCVSTTFAAMPYLALSLAYLKVFTADDNGLYHGIMPKIAIGYGDFTLGSFYFDVEAFAMPLQPSTIGTSRSVDGSILKPQYSYGVSVLPGVNLDGFVKGFIRLSYIYTHFKNIGTNNGAQAGFGLEAALYNGWSVRGELIRTQYLDSKDSFGRPRVDEGALTVVYHFWGTC